VLAVFLLLPLMSFAQGGDKQLRAKADALFAAGSYAEALPMYSQLVSLEPGDYDLNYRLGACSLYGGGDRKKAIGFLKFAVQGPATDNLAWYFLGRAYHLDYRFDEAISAYEHYRGTADRKLLEKFPVDAMEQQCRNGKSLLSNIKDIDVFNKVEVDASDFFRFYDLSDVGGKIVVTPDELLTSLDRKSKERSLVYLPNGRGAIYFSSYGKDGRTGRDIYRTTLLPTGGFSAPEKLTGYINTGQDEDFAAMAPDGKTLYFCSKGHNSMGGYDVFASTYDKASDTFGAPVNMDFAVNTPADEILYIVGPEGKEACFASTRESSQGMRTVYRVGTSQAPVNLTVLKGTFASAFDIADRKAHIVVEDALTRKKVADVRTDINGTYVLALPHGGRYNFLVEGGPSGKTHLGEVTVPSTAQPEAYRQEIKLIDQGGEKLDISNYFGEPLHEDVMALALDEIKRRARLDITEEPAVAGTEAPSSPAHDPMTAAGFAGNVSQEDAMDMAKKDQAELEDHATALDGEGEAAYALAVDNMAAAEEAAAHARELLGLAGTATDEARRTDLMTQAARARRQAQEADARAAAAFATGKELKTAAKSARDEAAQAKERTVALTQGIAAKDTSATIAALKDLKARIDAKSGPDAGIDEAERSRRDATEAEREASGKLARANSQRDDETALADRVGRLKRDMEEAKGHRKDELQKDLAVLEEQRSALREETDRAFAKAREAERDAVLARGRSALIGHLRSVAPVEGAAPSQEQLAGMERRIAAVDSGMGALAIDERYDPGASEPAAAREHRIFDWGAQAETEELASASVNTVPREESETGKQVDGATGTRSGDRDGKSDTNEPGTTSINDDGRSPVDADVADGNTEGKDRPDTAGISAMDLDKKPGTKANGQADSGTVQVDSTFAADRSLGNDDGVEDAAETERTEEALLPDGPGQYPPDTVSGNAEEQAFFVSNKLAELKQLRREASDKAERDSLDTEIRAQEGSLAALQEEEDVPGGHQYTLLDFDPATLDEQLVEDIVPGFAMRRKRIEEEGGDAQAQALAQQQLEQELVDSLDARTARQMAWLEQHPGQAVAIRQRLDRLEALRTLHARLAEESVPSAGQADVVATEAPAIDSGNAGGTVDRPEELVRQLADALERNTHVRAAPDPGHIYESRITYRSPKAVDAVTVNGRDVQAMGSEQAAIDSLGSILADASDERSREQLQQRMDRKTQELLSLRTDVGKRNGPLMAEEYALARDSATALQRLLPRSGRTDGALDSLALAYFDAARNSMEVASRSRKQADEVKDLAQRDSLYRAAFAGELHALDLMDRSITVRNFMLGRDAVRGETVTYAELRTLLPVQETETGRTGLAPETSSEGEDAVAAKEARPQEVRANETGLTPSEVRASRDTAASVSMLGDASPALGDTAIGQVHMPGTVGTEAIADGTAADTTSSPEHMNVPADEAPRASVPADLGPLAREDSLALFGYLGTSREWERSQALEVLQQADEARYFIYRGHAWAYRASADSLLMRATELTDQAWKLKGEAGTLGDDAVRADELTGRADAFFAQADSLRNAAGLLAGRASASDGQASAFLETLPPQRAQAILNLERPDAQTGLAAAPAPASSIVPGSTEPPAALDTASLGNVSTAAEPGAQDSSVASVSIPEDRSSAISTDSLAGAGAPGPERSPVMVMKPFRTGPALPRREGPIPMDPVMPKGVVYKVQVGAFRKALPQEAFQDMTPVSGEQAGHGLVRYTAGLFANEEQAAQARELLRARGYGDAFVVAYVDGRRVPLGTAAKLMAVREAGPVMAQAPAPVRPVEVPVVARPVAASAANNADSTALAKYPGSAEEVLAAFHPSAADTAYYADPSAAPAKQVEAVKGLFFTVQVGVYSKPTPLDRLFNITPLNSERTETGKIRYTTGIYRDLDSARSRRGVTVSLGVTDAFVTAYLNGKRIPVHDARVLLAKFGPSVLVDPSLGMP
jgi:hypothetical protein